MPQVRQGVHRASDKGIDLARLVQQSGPLAIPQACKFIRQAAKGLQYAHEKRLVHRDIKPGNLMVSRPRIGQSPTIKILDFGLSRFEGESERTTRLTQLGQVVGTVDYVAPEQSQNPQMADIRADIYSLGCSLFHSLTGNPPFPGADAAEKISARVLADVPSVRKSRPEVSPALEQILAKMTARDPADRFQTPGEVVKELKPHCGEGTDTLHWSPPGMPDSTAKPIEAWWSPLERLPLLEECGRKAGGSPAFVDAELERQTLPVVNVELIAAKVPEDYPRTAEPAKRRRLLLSASIAFALCSIVCLGLAILLYTASSDTQSAMPGQPISNSIAMKSASAEDGKGPRMKLQQAVLRGGSFLDVAGVCRSALRNPRETSLRGANVGFRVVCEISR